VAQLDVEQERISFINLKNITAHSCLVNFEEPIPASKPLITVSLSRLRPVLASHPCMTWTDCIGWTLHALRFHQILSSLDASTTGFCRATCSRPAAL
jgi:hypothetical protein